MGKHFRAGRRPQAFVATDMVAVLVGVEDASDGSASPAGNCKTSLPVERVYGHGVASFFTGDEIVVIAPRITRPNTLDDHLCK